MHRLVGGLMWWKFRLGRGVRFVGFLFRGDRSDKFTFFETVDGDVVERYHLGMGTQGGFGIAEEVLFQRYGEEVLEEAVVSVDAATRLVEFDDFD
jgi:hypothetical protein